MSTSPSRSASGAALAVEEAPEKPVQSLVESLLAPPEVRQTHGRVEEQQGAELLVRVGAELVRSRRSKSCLVEPGVGDTVLVARSEPVGSALLAGLLFGEIPGGIVAHLHDDQPGCTVAVEGDLTLRARSGKVSIAADETVSVVAGRSVTVHAPELTATTMKATVFADALSYVGRTLDAQVDKVKHVGRKLESVIDVVTSHMKHSQRTIEEVERVKAKELHIRAEATLNVHGKNTVLTAEKLVKLDGEQIHLG